VAVGENAADTEVQSACISLDSSKRVYCQDIGTEKVLLLAVGMSSSCRTVCYKLWWQHHSPNLQ